MKKKIVFILGTGHCGSTLLDLILSSSNDAFGLGELWQLGVQEGFRSGSIPISNIKGDEDSFWSKERRKRVLRFFKERGKLVRKLQHMGLVKLPYNDLYTYLFNETGANTLIDSSKSFYWLSKVLPEISRKELFEPYLLYLVRDARAVISSYFRKYPERGLEAIVKDWQRRVGQLDPIFDTFEGEKKIVRYEELCLTPAKEVKGIMDWVGSDFDNAMLRFWEKDHHHIGGNSGTKSLLLKFREQDSSHLLQDEQKTKYYSSHDLGIKLDERWKSDLKPEEVSFIEKLISEHQSAHFWGEVHS